MNPTWLDIVALVVTAIGTAATSVIAVVAVRVSLRLSREAREREQVDARRDWAADFMAWLIRGQHRVATGEDAPDDAWEREGERLAGRAKVHESAGAERLLDAAGAALTALQHTRPHWRPSLTDATIPIIGVWANAWVLDPREPHTGDIAIFIRAWEIRRQIVEESAWLDAQPD